MKEREIREYEHIVVYPYLDKEREEANGYMATFCAWKYKEAKFAVDISTGNVNILAVMFNVQTRKKEEVLKYLKDRRIIAKNIVYADKISDLWYRKYQKLEQFYSKSLYYHPVKISETVYKIKEETLSNSPWTQKTNRFLRKEDARKNLRNTIDERIADCETTKKSCEHSIQTLKDRIKDMENRKEELITTKQKFTNFEDIFNGIK